MRRCLTILVRLCWFHAGRGFRKPVPGGDRTQGWQEEPPATLQRTARDLVRVRELRRAFREFYARCFWYMRPDAHLTLDDLPEVVRGLRKNGGKEGILRAAKLCR